MNQDLFRRYVWLVDTLRRTSKMTFEEISTAWVKCPLNRTREPIPLRTFHNHRVAISQLFGIRIVCRRGGGNYYQIVDDSMPGLTRLRIWMLLTLGTPPPNGDFSSVEHRIVLDEIPTKSLNLATVVEAITANIALDVTMRNDERFILEPYGVGFIENIWRICGKDEKTDLIREIILSDIKLIEPTSIPFTYPEDFDPKGFFTRHRSTWNNL